MKNIPLLITLLVPGMAMADVCDMSGLMDIEQEYLSLAPACISSGDYSSDSCARIDELNARSNQAAASVRALRCDDSGYTEIPGVAPLRMQVLSLQRAQASKSQAETTAKPDNGHAICTRLMGDIALKYDLLDLKLIPNKSDISSFYPIVPCTYEAIRPTARGNIPVIVHAQLNQSNKRYRISLR